MLNNYLNEREKTRFSATVETVTASLRENNGVGTLQEKTLHAVVKNFCEENTDFHEKKLCGYVADVFNGAMVTEVQTRSFYKLKNKLNAFLPLYPVTVVYPIVHHRRIYRVNTITGEVSKPRKSPKTGNIHFLFAEMYGLADLINHPGVKFRALLIDIDEYRLVKGDKDRGEKGDLIPTAINADYRFECLEDFASILPDGLPEEFTIEQYKGLGKMHRELAGYEIRVLARLGIIEEAGRKGRSKLWRVCEY